MEILFILESSLLLLSPPPAAPEPGTGVFHLHTRNYAKLPIYFGNQRVIGVVSLTVDKLFLRRTTNNGFRSRHSPTGRPTTPRSQDSLVANKKW